MTDPTLRCPWCGEAGSLVSDQMNPGHVLPAFVVCCDPQGTCCGWQTATYRSEAEAWAAARQAQNAADQMPATARTGSASASTCTSDSAAPVQAQPVAEVCVWSQDDEDSGYWETGCGNAFLIAEGEAGDSTFRFCCYCGAKCEADRYVTEPDDEDEPAPQSALKGTP